jgi:hypothetical protein
LRKSSRMTEAPWLSITITWAVVLVLGGILWQRFTRVPIQPSGSSRTPTTTRRVMPLWLALVLLILLICAIWLTVRWVTGR